MRSFLDAAYQGEFADEDWEHALGGVHVVVRDGGELVAHAAVVQRRLVVGERPLRAGYVEALAVRGDRRREGLAAAVMTPAERIVASAYDVGALSDGTGIDGFYERRGWLRWVGETWVVAPTGRRRTEEDDGGVYVLRTPMSPDLDPAGTIACDWRPGDVW